jgi:hypothetical protein
LRGGFLTARRGWGLRRRRGCRAIAGVAPTSHDEGIALTALALGGGVRGGFSAVKWWGGAVAVTFTTGAAARVGDHVGFFSVFVGFGAGGGLVV